MFEFGFPMKFANNRSFERSERAQLMNEAKYAQQKAFITKCVFALRVYPSGMPAYHSIKVLIDELLWQGDHKSR